MDELILLVEYILETEKRHTMLNRLQAIEASLKNTLQASQQGNIDQARKLGKQAAGQIASLIQVLEESEPRQFTKQQRALFERLDASDLIGATAAIKLRNAMLEHASQIHLLFTVSS